MAVQYEPQLEKSLINGRNYLDKFCKENDLDAKFGIMHCFYGMLITRNNIVYNALVKTNRISVNEYRTAMEAYMIDLSQEDEKTQEIVDLENPNAVNDPNKNAKERFEANFIRAVLLADNRTPKKRGNSEGIETITLYDAMLDTNDKNLKGVLELMDFDYNNLFLTDKDVDDFMKFAEEEELLEKSGVFLTDQKFLAPPGMFREREVDRLIRNALLMKKPNSLIVGAAGVGKTAVVEQFAYLLQHNRVPSKLKGMKIYEVHVSNLVAGTQYRGQFEDKLTKIVAALEKREDIILFIDEFHTSVKAGGSEGSVTMSDILKPALARGKIKVIGATTSKEFNIVMKDPAYRRRFNKVFIKELDIRQTYSILSVMKSVYENHFNLTIEDGVLIEVVKESKSFNGVFPDKALNYLEQLCAEVMLVNGSELKVQHVVSTRDNQVFIA